MKNTISKKNNKEKSIIYMKNYDKWKQIGVEEYGFCIIFNGFISSMLLSKISGNALKLYVYLNINSNNKTGEVWHSTKTISLYFNKSERTIRNWFKELEELNLIKRMQLEFNGVSHNYLQPYPLGKKRK